MAPSADSVAVSAVAASTPYSESQQAVTLTANVTDVSNTSTAVNEGTISFTVVNASGNTVGSPVQGTVSSGSATASFTLPADEAAGNYTIDVSYTDSADNFTDNGTDTPATLAVSAASTTTTVTPPSSVSYSTSAQPVTLTATVTSSGGTVDEGSVQFTLINSTGKTIGTAVSGSLTSNGSASVSYGLPAYTLVGSYTIEADYSDSAGNFDASSDNSQDLTVSAASTTTTATSATAAFSTSAQNVTLTATVTSDAGTVNEGTVTFTILQGTTVIGTATTSDTVNDGSASVSYSLPAGTDAGSYTIEAAYSDSAGNFAASSDDSQTLTVTSSTAAATTTTASDATATFSSSAQNVTLTATVTSSSGTVNEGTVTFTILQGTTVIGTATSGTVSSGSASVSYSLPASTAQGTYTIEANYSDSSGNFASSSDTTHTLTVSGLSTTTTASNATAAFSTSDQDVTLTATVTSSSGTVNEGTVTFTILQGVTVIGTATSGTVSAGSATVSYALPGGTGAGSYTIEADYSDSSGGFAASSDDSHTLTVTSSTAAATTTTAVDVTATYSTSAQDVTLNADVTSSAGTVNVGNVTFTILQGTTVIGTATSGTVSGGSATVSYSLPADTAPGAYTIEADYNDSSGTYDLSSDTSHTLTVSAVSTTTTAASATATYSTSDQDVTLTATVTSSGGTVNEGTMTFTLVNDLGDTVGTAVSAAVSGGSASVSYALPAYTVVGSYTIEAAYSDSSGNFASSSDDTHSLAVNAASTTTTATSATAPFSTSDQNVTLTATVTSSAGTVNEGSVTFTLLDSNGNTIGTPISGTVANGSASVSYTLPGGTAAGSYTIEVDYSDSVGNFADSSDDTQMLTVSIANSTSLSLPTVNINPNMVNGTAQVTLTAQVSNPGGTVNEGIVSFTVAGVSGQANVSNGTATVTLTVSLPNVLSGLSVVMSYTDNSGSANFANSSSSMLVSTNVWNAVLPANLKFDSSNNETMQFTVGSLPLFGASYSAALGGMLSQINIGSLSVPMVLTTLGSLEIATAGGVPWGIIFNASNGNMQGIGDVETASDGSLEWVFYNNNHQVIGEMPYGGY